MVRRYVAFSVYHPGKERKIGVDIEVDADNDTNVFDDVIIPILNDFVEAGLDASYGEIKLHDTYSHPDYVGNVSDIIHRILEESGGDI